MTNDPTKIAAAAKALQSIMSPREAIKLGAQTLGDKSNQPSNGIFTPTEALTSIRAIEMIALMGGPGSGKTTSLLWDGGFPNRLWLDFDHNLPTGELSIPFWNTEFCDSICKPSAGFKNSNRRDAFKIWLRDNHKKFSPEQTLIVDSWTLLMSAFNEQTNAEDDRLEIGKSGEKNFYWFWEQLARFTDETLITLKSCKCRVVVTFHETRERDAKTRQFNGKLRPVMDGQFKDKIFGYFTDAWRQMKNPAELDERGKKVMRGTEFVTVEGHFWQLVGDDIVDCKMNSELSRKIREKRLRMIPASYTELEKIYNS